MRASAALSAVVVLLAASARAQDLAPAEERPGRYVLLPLSVERPAGAEWVLLRRTDTEVVFLRPATAGRNGQLATAGVKVPGKRLHTVQDLAAGVRDELKKGAGAGRFETLEETVQPEAAGAVPCVRYRQRVRDLGARDGEGEPQVIELHGQACLHPDDGGLVLSATLSERGPAQGIPSDLAEQAARFFAGIRPHAPLTARDWRTLAEKRNAAAQVWLARALFRTNELEEAIVWLERAADQGHPEARALLGLSYLTGRAVRRNPQEALKWLRPAAAAGYPRAAGLLALALLTAAEVRDEEEGRRWVHQAAAAGDPLGQALLGELLLEGRAGSERNETEAAAWLQRAAAQGEARAQFMLAGLHANGRGVAQDAVRARFWLELAAAQGHTQARRMLEQIRHPPPAAAPSAGRE